MVVDDRAMPRIAARAMLGSMPDIVHVGEAASGEEALRLVRRLKPDLVLLDVDMADMDGPETAQQLLASSPHLKILAWTVSDSSDDLVRMIQVGCVGYVLKDVGPEELYSAIQAALRDDFPVPRKMVPQVIKRVADQGVSVETHSVPLTDRELETLRWVAKGLPTKTIAHNMKLSAASVDTHLRNIYRKLDVNNRSEAVNVALKQRVLRLTDL
jgi:DNA-binding NarL/FixJ family response regulator